jgi:hypothetical protein
MNCCNPNPNSVKSYYGIITLLQFCTFLKTMCRKVRGHSIMKNVLRNHRRCVRSVCITKHVNLICQFKKHDGRKFSLHPHQLCTLVPCPNETPCRGSSCVCSVYLRSRSGYEFVYKNIDFVESLPSLKYLICNLIPNVFNEIYGLFTDISMLGGSLVTTAWRVLRLRMERSPPGTEGSCECTE